MVTFLPFPGLRPLLENNEDIADRISPPYDVIGNDYLKKLQSNEHNVTRLTLMPENGRYTSARQELEKWIKDNALVQDKDSFYLYRQSFSDDGREYVRTGLIGILKTEQYENGNVIPHEETFSKVKEDRLNLLRDMETHLESIFGIYEGFTNELDSQILKNAVPLYCHVDDAGVEHSISQISDPSITGKISKELEKQKMLIADGHHRYETALNYSMENPDDKKKGYVLATLVSAKDEGLVIWPTHRLLRSDKIKESDAIALISREMETEEVTKEEMEKNLKKWQMGLMFRSGRCFLARFKDETPDAHAVREQRKAFAKAVIEHLWTLDTYVAQEIILKKMYGYNEGSVTVSYDAEYTSVEKKMSGKEYDLAIVLNEPSLKGIWDLSMKGKRMPKKTTFFYPKIWSGFVFYRMF